MHAFYGYNRSIHVQSVMGKMTAVMDNLNRLFALHAEKLHGVELAFIGLYIAKELEPRDTLQMISVSPHKNAVYLINGKIIFDLAQQRIYRLTAEHAVKILTDVPMQAPLSKDVIKLLANSSRVSSLRARL